MTKAGLRVLVPWEHPEQMSDDGKPKTEHDFKRLRNKMNAGFVESMRIASDGKLIGKLNIPLEEDAKRLGQTIHAVSPEFGGVWEDPSGNEWVNPITHVALTPRPVQAVQDGFVRLSMMDYLEGEQGGEPVFQLSDLHEAVSSTPTAQTEAHAPGTSNNPHREAAHRIVKKHGVAAYHTGSKMPAKSHATMAKFHDHEAKYHQHAGRYRAGSFHRMLANHHEHCCLRAMGIPCEPSQMSKVNHEALEHHIAKYNYHLARSGSSKKRTDRQFQHYRKAIHHLKRAKAHGSDEPMEYHIGGSQMSQVQFSNWIKGAIKKPGALHRELGVPQGKKIPESKLRAAEHAKGKLGKRARLAEVLKHLHHATKNSRVAKRSHMSLMASGIDPESYHAKRAFVHKMAATRAKKAGNHVKASYHAGVAKYHEREHKFIKNTPGYARFKPSGSAKAHLQSMGKALHGRDLTQHQMSLMETSAKGHPHREAVDKAAKAGHKVGKTFVDDKGTHTHIKPKSLAHHFTISTWNHSGKTTSKFGLRSPSSTSQMSTLATTQFCMDGYSRKKKLKRRKAAA